MGNFHSRRARRRRSSCVMSPTMMDGGFAQSGGFVIQSHGHRDMVEASSFNDYGTRFALGSADGKIKVYDRLRDGGWSLCDTWGAHSTEVLEVGGSQLTYISTADPNSCVGFHPQSTPTSSHPYHQMGSSSCGQKIPQSLLEMDGASIPAPTAQSTKCVHPSASHTSLSTSNIIQKPAIHFLPS